MKVYNLTDVETETLKQRGLVGQHIAVSDRMVEPGSFVEVADSAVERAKLGYLVTVGAVSIDSIPPNYTKARAARDSAATGAPVRHVDMQETRIAAQAPSQPQRVPGESAELKKHEPKDEVADAEAPPKERAGSKRR